MDMKPIGIDVSQNAAVVNAARKEADGTSAPPSESFQASEGGEKLPLMPPAPGKGPGASEIVGSAASNQVGGNEKEALAILRGSSSSDEEASQDLAWLKSHMPPGAELTDMAEFYAIGRGIYQPGNAKREELLEESLMGIDELLKSSLGYMASLTVDEKKECLKILLAAIPQKAR